MSTQTRERTNLKEKNNQNRQGFWSDVAYEIKRSPAEAVGIAVAAGAVLGGLVAAMAMPKKRSFLRYAPAGLAEGMKDIKSFRSRAERGLNAICNALDEIRQVVRP